MPIYKAGDIWDAMNAKPLSAFEFRTKMKSREAVWYQAKVPGSSPDLDKSMKMCAAINNASVLWALEHAEASVLSRYKSKGEPIVIADDKEATIGVTGPEWIKDELVFTRETDGTSPTGKHLSVQSWTFVVGNTNHGSVPWFFPVGMHYCKLLSPARAMEWIYTDSMRASAMQGSAVMV